MTQVDPVKISDRSYTTEILGLDIFMISNQYHLSNVLCHDYIKISDRLLHKKLFLFQTQDQQDYDVNSDRYRNRQK